ncbi:Glycosyltransferase like family 2 [Nocardioides scoriae]|uniref:Glycosyltransferase like family 2 n=1 Tax=Nocardioides scoriae TaxID=642780 RepID=A0A1H1NQ04_9ACTN|nr:glycosyltransferase family A protein [Nocardioides scoriae]SDS01077.1 Glycosyltransferase like family 2 [Nocardioides scoriae]
MRPATALVRGGTGLALASLALTLVNLARLRVPAPATVPGAATPAEPLVVLLPVRDEVDVVEDCVDHLVAAIRRWPGPARLLVLDDGSTDGTAAALDVLAQRHDLVEVLLGSPPPPGWLGKPWACRQLALHAGDASVLAFVDADVRVAPDGLVASVALLRAAGLDLVSPYPRQEAHTAAERLVQPLLQWSWLATLPLDVAERSARPSTAVGNGQLLVVDAGAYARCGGHGAVRGEVLEDLALVRSLKRAGGRGTVVDGTHVARCRMYDGWPDLRAGYGKSLWAAFGSPAGAAAAHGLLLTAYVVPAVAALGGSRTGLLGYAAGVAARAAVARRTGGRAWPDPLAHPVSVLALAGLTVDSFRGRRAGTLRWKGRPVEAPAVHPSGRDAW